MRPGLLLLLLLVTGCGLGNDPVGCRTSGIGCNYLAERVCDRDFTCRFRRSPDGSGDCDGYYSRSPDCLSCLDSAACETNDAGHRSLTGCSGPCTR